MYNIYYINKTPLKTGYSYRLRDNCYCKPGPTALSFLNVSSNIHMCTPDLTFKHLTAPP